MPVPHESPRRIALAVVVALALTAAAAPLVAVVVSWAFPAPAHHYQARVLCGKNGEPSRSCHLQDIPRAQFVDHYDAQRPYRRCVTKPNRVTYCDGLKTAPLADTPIADPLDIDQVGRWRCLWRAQSGPPAAATMHAMDAQEVAMAIHVIQNKLLSRPTYRRYLETLKSQSK